MKLIWFDWEQHPLWRVLLPIQNLYKYMQSVYSLVAIFYMMARNLQTPH